MSKRNLALLLALIVAVGAAAALMARLCQKKRRSGCYKHKDNCFSVDMSCDEPLPIGPDDTDDTEN